jgi:hypothetical protein
VAPGKAVESGLRGDLHRHCLASERRRLRPGFGETGGSRSARVWANAQAASTAPAARSTPLLPRVCTSAPVGPVELKAAASARAPRHSPAAGDTDRRKRIWAIGAARDSAVDAVRRHIGTGVRGPGRTTASIRVLARRLQAPDARFWRNSGSGLDWRRVLLACQRDNARNCPGGRAASVGGVAVGGRSRSHRPRAGGRHGAGWFLALVSSWIVAQSVPRSAVRQVTRSPLRNSPPA